MIDALYAWLAHLFDRAAFAIMLWFSGLGPDVDWSEA